ncbi:nucleoside phosphorylase [Clostridium sp. SYSU_GA19001]|uniref:5'-methylthioadenosine/S-adenosylhomocysteine nucleosidase family protein n=1 Tax=Clostridium caldaquaticum TaxID=2940653 RepID=UPI002077830D|nr:nucleoside phosphorylase [Clostridium caldaquaticum]MCM8709859.1 nucleoside phosphorylase [Clostridium caldaquaticum]
MIFIVTALMIEAAPIIEHYKLKKDMTIHAYPVYKNSEITLIISGVGKVKSAMAAVYLLSNYKFTVKDILLNIGFCGSSSNKFELGSLLAAHKITDMDTGKDYYPDIFAGSNIPKVALCCYSKLLKKEALDTDKDIFCDMESAGIMEVSQKFTYAHQVIILKIISDFLKPENLNKDILQGYIKKNLTYIKQVIEELIQLNNNFDEFSLEEEEKLLNYISKNLRFTTAMKQLLFKEIKKAKIRGLEPLKVLEPFMKINVNSKLEGKNIFEQINEKFKKRLV